MTRKSQARIARDTAAAKQNQASAAPAENAPVWEDLNQFYSESAQSIVNSSAVAQLLSNPEFVQRASAAGELTRYSALLLKDTTHYKNQLLAIKAQHDKRSGPVAAEDVMTLFAITEQYANWNMEWESVVVPTIQTILDMADETTATNGPAVEGAGNV